MTENSTSVKYNLDKDYDSEDYKNEDTRDN